MLSQLKANQGKQVAIELVSGKSLFGTILEVDEKTLRMDTDEGVATILVDSIQIILENNERALEEVDMEEIVQQLRDVVEARYVCLGWNGFRCPVSYTCRRPHRCNRFTCPGSFSIGQPPPDMPCVTAFYGMVGPRQEKKAGSEEDPKE
ncbi:hypothetical protein [Sporomusa malonica]|uniref:Uncharacterized protein n=1 Tax=Sporomusa malonica TaxID=112901 RepID=A0A1W2EEW3_9FIRM|nr:hypothetical protein [Sporomusa malonica]SMD08187.1 hypothetical protein SAMN04488500_12399 [Sporomusa malonica]